MTQHHPLFSLSSPTSTSSLSHPTWGLLCLLSLPGCFTRRYIPLSLDFLRLQSLAMARHPFQRLSSPSRSLSLALHVLGVLSFSYNFHFLTVWETPFAVAYGWH